MDADAVIRGFYMYCYIVLQVFCRDLLSVLRDAFNDEEVFLGHVSGK